MTVTRFLSCVLLAAFALPFTAAALPAQERASSLQAEAARRFKDLHDRMQKLQLVKAKTEPEQARLLDAGNRFIQERALHDGMDEVRTLIENARFDEALERMERLKRDMTTLLELLLNRDLELQDLLEKIARLEKYLDRVDEVLAEQKAEKNDAASTEALEKHLRDLQAAKQRVDDLIRDQKALRTEANDAGMAAEPKKADQMAEREGELRETATDLAKRLELLEKDAAELGTKPAESGEPADGAAGGEGSPGAGSCQGAAGAMGQAQEKLQQNKPERSLQDMDQAIRKLEQTMQALEAMSDEARRKLLQLPFEQQVRAQEQTRIDTDRLAQDMEAQEQHDGEAPGEQVPGKKNVQQAVPKQKAAAGQLKDFKPSEAKQEQQDAIEDLEEAKKALEDALAQLRQQLTDEVLRSLEERFGAMLAKQKELSAQTKAIDRVHRNSLVANDAVPAQVARTCADLSSGEAGLGAEARDALELLAEDGRTAAFPMIVEEIRDDLDAVARRLAKNQCERITQDMQADIEDALKDLLDALRRTIENRAGGT